jgi:hypothetical protein
MTGGIVNANESACPGCGHSSDHKKKGPCWYCTGTGECKATRAALALSDCNIDQPLEDFLLNPIDQTTLTNTK